MSSAPFPQKYYSMRYQSAVVNEAAAASGPDAASLAAIEAVTLDAHTAYWNRRYRDAINDYQQAAAKIYALIDPEFDPSWRHHVVLPRDPGLFEPLTSAAAEYLNVLPVNQPSIGPRPRVAVDPKLLVGNGQGAELGIQSTQLATREAVTALANWQLAQNYTALGMPQSAAAFTAQAKTSDPKLVEGIDVHPAQQAAPAAATPSAVATPAVHAAVERAPTLSTTALLSGASIEHLTVALQAGAHPALPSPFLEGRTAATIVGGKPVQLAWPAGSAPPVAQIVSNIYQARIGVTVLPDILLAPQTPSDVALSLPHQYYYVIPMALAECHHALGDWAQAETYYLQAASYQYINSTVEAPYVWTQLATLYLDWGNSLFKNGQPSDALPIYSNVVTPAWQAPTGQLYTVAGIKAGADIARKVIAALPNVTALGLDPQIVAVILDVRQQLLKIQGSLDFWGIWQPCVPIWTFDYLQQVAINFAQLAISAERDVINFWNNADQATLARQQLSDSVDQANTEVNAQQMAVDAASAEQAVYADGATLAQQRQKDAQQQATDYQNLSSQWIMHQALSAQLNGGDDGNSTDLNNYANTMMSGNYDFQNQSRGTLSAAEQLTASRLNQQYEVESLKDTATELQLAANQANAESAAAQAQVQAAKAGLSAAQTRANDAKNDVTVFDNQTFTADVWNRLGKAMDKIYTRYFTMALRAARLMQQAYNFETDQSLSLIKSSYASDEVNGLLGADLLMADIQTFTYDLITGSNTKPQPVKQTISLAERCGYLFESQFRKTGTMDFTTTLDDFDAAYPGSYAGRIQTVEIEVDGIVPPTGVSGLLTNSGISTYRVPSAAWTATNDGRKYRVQPKETLIISDYSPRSDVLVDPTDTRMMRIFEGAGPASTWHLELLPSINDLDYGAITDVKLTFSYLARYDSDLHDRVLQEITGRPGFNARQRAIPLRWVCPDAFFAFQRSGTLAWELRQADFPFNERNPVLTDVGLVVATTGTPPSGITFGLTTPTHTAAVTAVTDAGGSIESDTAANPWAPQASGTAVGPYTLTITAASNPQLVKAGALDLSAIANVGFILGYTFTAR